MKKFLIIASLFIVSQGHAQQVKKDSNGNYISARIDTGANRPTGKTYTDGKGKVYPLLISSRGKLYYLRTAKSGNIYKAYLKVTE